MARHNSHTERLASTDMWAAGLVCESGKVWGIVWSVLVWADLWRVWAEVTGNVSDQMSSDMWWVSVTKGYKSMEGLFAARMFLGAR